METAIPTDTLRPWVEGDTRVTVSGAGAFADLPRWADRVGAQHVLIVARSASGVAARLAATTLAGARPDVAVAHRVRPTTSLALAASALTALETGGDAVTVLQAFDQLVARSTSGIWLRSVTRLHQPKPGFGMHVRSLVSRGFVATTTPTPQVGRTLDLAEDGPPLLVAADPDSAEFAAVSTLAATHTVQTVPVLADVAKAYGSRGAEYACLAAVPPPMGPQALCPTCGIRQSGTVCPYCHTHLRVPEPA